MNDTIVQIIQGFANDYKTAKSKDDNDRYNISIECARFLGNTVSGDESIQYMSLYYTLRDQDER